SGMTVFDVPSNTRTEIENIGEGVLSPLDGFLNENDFDMVLKNGRLSNGIPWTIPIILDVDESTALKLKDSGEVLLSSGGDEFGILYVTDIYRYEKLHMVRSVFGTEDLRHPGVSKVFAMNNTLIGGKTKVFSVGESSAIRRFRLSPIQTRKEIDRANWK